MTSEQERREFVRVPFRTTMIVRTAERTIRSTSSLDISLTGLRVAVSGQVPAVGALCEVEIVLADADPPVVIEARGAIVRADAGLMAVHFTEVDLDGFDHLRRLILYNADDPERAEQEFDAHWGIRPPLRPPQS